MSPAASMYHVISRRVARNFGLIMRGHISILLLFFSLPSFAQQVGRSYLCRIHDPASPVDFYANATGGGRGFFGDAEESRVTQTPGPGWHLEIHQVKDGQWTYAGITNALLRALEDQVSVRPEALWHPMILQEYQPRLQALRLQLRAAESSRGRPELRLRIELKGHQKTGAEVLRQAHEVPRHELLGGAYPRDIRFEVDAQAGPLGLVLIMLDGAVPGDSIELGPLDAEVLLPADIPHPRRGALLGLGALLANWDEATGMVQDRGSFPAGIYENMTATAKLAKILALALHQGLLEPGAAHEALAKITTTLLDVVPRGPLPTNRLWPHFTRNGGAARHEGSEWGSGDAAYAATDLALALALSGDRQGRLSEVLHFLHEVDWQALFHEGFYRHGYDREGRLIPHRWEGFGAETLGINFAALAGGGPLAEMLLPPTDDGSGFNMHVGYPLPFEGLDRHGNDWTALRLTEARAQVGWYQAEKTANPHWARAGLFGLSAAETPDGKNYLAYGIGGRLDPARDGGRSVVTPHYSGMVASLVPEAATQMLESLEARGWVTPLNHTDSLAADPVTGLETVNWMKGSWNLTLFTEGWLMADPATARAAREALLRIPEFAQAWRAFFPAESSQ